MKSEWIRKRTAKATVCWVLSLGMVASTPQLAMIQAYAAETEQGGEETSAKVREDAMNLTLHIDNASAQYEKPALQFWDDDETIVSGAMETNQKITGWDGAVGQILTKDGDTDFYSVTINGNFKGFQFLDYATPSKNTNGQGFESTMEEYKGATPTDLYYICKDGTWGWYTDAQGSNPLKVAQKVYVTMHVKPETVWTTPVMQHWNDKLEISDSSKEAAITGWGVSGNCLTPEDNGFYKITVKGTFGGFQFVDAENGNDTKTGDATYDKLLNTFTKETPSDVYYIQKDGNWNWYLDAEGTTPLASIKKVEDQAIANANGTITFTAVAENANKVEVKYGKKAEVETKGESALTTITLSSDASVKNAYTSKELFIDDEEFDLVYSIIVDGTPKQISDGVTIGNTTYLSYHRDKYTGRTVCVPGTFPGKSWDVASNKMEYIGKGLYAYTFKNVPAANYEYKISMGTWDENYGENGAASGSNIAVTVPDTQDVTIYYSDLSHYSRCSVNYQYGANVGLEGTGIPAGTKFSDDRLTGVYSATVSDMEAGTYQDTKIATTNETINLEPYTVDTKKNVTFYYDPESGVYYSDASDAKVNGSALKFDSKDTTYKSVYGAVATGEKVTYFIDTGADVTAVKFIVKGVAKQNLPMKKVDGAVGGKQRWSVTTSFDKLGEYHYFFAVYNGTAAMMYGDDDGYYGTGKSSDLLSMLPYDQIVYQSGYKTPDWMKNAVIYQIFPDRFYNGDTSNDEANTSARGPVNYEKMNDWYILPENPEQETTNPGTYPSNAYKGDGNWSNEIYGGDLKGITKRIDYLKALGVSVIYLNPVFESISSHRYDTSDYKNIDPILGTLGDFEELVNVAEKNGMHIVLDGVFNHVSDDSVYFDRYYEYLEKGTDTIGAYPYWAYVYDTMSEKNVSKEEAEKQAKEYFTKNYGITNYDYTQWFDVFDTTLKDDNQKEVCDTVGLRAGKPVYGYDGWWGYDSMPIIKATNGSEYQTGTWAQDVIGKNETSTSADNSVAQYWLSKGMDGWRLDVANEVSDETWQHFRKSVKALDSDNVIIGEIWTDAVKYLMGDMYDSVMNYMFRGAAIAYAKGGTSEAAMNTLERLRERYPKEAFYAMMNLVDSHDTTRLLSYLDGIDDDRNQKEVDKAFPSYETTSEEAKKKQYLVALMQFTYAGAPTIYYGDELGMVGADDPDDRRAMIWGEGNESLVKWYAKLATIRNNYTALRTGSVEPVKGTGDEILSYVRRDNSDTMLVAMNNSATAKDAVFDLNDLKLDATALTDVISGTNYTVVAGKVTISIPAYNGVILTASDKAKSVTIDENALKPGFDPAYKITDNKTTKTNGGSTGGSSSSGSTTTETKPSEDTKKDTTTIVIPAEKLPEGTTATVTVTKDASGKVTAEAAVAATGKTSKTGVKATVNADVIQAVTEAAGTKDVTITQEVKKADGTTAYTVQVNAADVKAGAKLAVMKKDEKTGELVLVNKKSYKVTKDGSVSLTFKDRGVYVLKTQAEVKAAAKQIAKTIAPAKSTVNIGVKKTTVFQWSKKLNMENVAKITYKSSKKSVVSVNKNGKITGKKKGTGKVTATVTLKDGTKKIVTIKVTVK